MNCELHVQFGGLVYLFPWFVGWLLVWFSGSVSDRIMMYTNNGLKLTMQPRVDSNSIFSCIILLGSLLQIYITGTVDTMSVRVCVCVCMCV